MIGSFDAAATVTWPYHVGVLFSVTELILNEDSDSMPCWSWRYCSFKSFPQGTPHYSPCLHVFFGEACRRVSQLVEIHAILKSIQIDCLSNLYDSKHITQKVL